MDQTEAVKRYMKSWKSTFGFQDSNLTNTISALRMIVMGTRMRECLSV